MKSIYLLADIGNTSIDIAIYHNHEFKKNKFFIHDADLLHTYFSSLPCNEIKSCLISSVNQTGLSCLTKELDAASISYQVLDAKRMDAYCQQNNLKVSNSSYLGGDLFLDIIAPNEKPIIVIDLGTVGKILFLDKENTFQGGTIFPDILQFPKMLNLSTDLLAKVDLIKNPPLLSLKTEECISSGAIHGIASLVAGMTNQIKKTYSALDAKVYLTGGSSHIIKDFLPLYDLKEFIYDEDLTIKGLIRLIN